MVRIDRQLNYVIYFDIDVKSNFIFAEEFTFTENGFSGKAHFMFISIKIGSLDYRPNSTCTAMCIVCIIWLVNNIYLPHVPRAT